MKKKYIFVFGCVLVFLFSLYIRIIHLNDIPANFNPDEADTLGRYIFVTESPNVEPVFFEFNWNGAPIINTYIIGTSWKMFNETILGARLPSAVITSVGIVLTFMLIFFITQNGSLSILISIALATNPWLLSFSRSAWENAWNILPLSLMALGFELAIHGKKNAIFLMTSGAILGFYGYHPGKTYIIPLVIGFVLLARIYRRHSRHIIILLMLNLILYLLFILPQLLVMLQSPFASFGRISTVSIFQEAHPFQYMQKSLLDNIRGLLFFAPYTTYIGLNARYVPQDVPIISIVFLPLFLFGLIGSLARYKNHHVWYGLAFLCVLFPVQLLSRGTPDAARGVHAVGMYYLLIALGGWYVWNMVKRIFNYHSTVIIITHVVFASVVVFVILTDISLYFSWITSQQALRAREPAIPSSGFETWKNELKTSIRESGDGFNVGEWKTGNKPH